MNSLIIFFGIRTNVWLAWIAAAIGIIVYLALARRHTGQEPSVYRHGREWVAASAVDSDDTYPEVDESKEAVVPAKSPAKVKATRSVTSGAGSK